MNWSLERYRGLADFRHALRRFLAASEAINSQAGVTPLQYQAMLAIKAATDETLAIKGLAETLVLTHHAAVQLVDRLAKAGLAARRASPADRRSVLLGLTPKGEALLAELTQAHLDEMLRLEPMLAQSLKRLKRLAP